MNELKLFCEDEISIGAECPKCRRVLKIHKSNIVVSGYNIILRSPIVCPCKQTYTAIKKTHKRYCSQCGCNQPFYEKSSDSYSIKEWDLPVDHTYKACRVCDNSLESSVERPEPTPADHNQIALAKDGAILEAASHDRILAMKLYRDAYGGSLAEAKKFIDSLLV